VIEEKETKKYFVKKKKKVLGVINHLRKTTIIDP